jgi:hypothetical protein
MSTSILFDINAVWLPDANGEPLFLGSEQWGSNNMSDAHGYIARSWSARYFGSFKDVLADACEHPTGWQDAGTQFGEGNAYHAASAEAYIERVEKAMRKAFRTCALVVNIDRCHYKPTCFDEISAFYDTLKSTIDGPPSEGPWRVAANPMALKMLVELTRFVSKRTATLSVLFDARKEPGEIAFTATLADFKDGEFRLPHVYRTRAIDNAGDCMKLLLQDDGTPELASDYRLYRHIVKRAQEVAYYGGDPKCVFRSFTALLRDAPWVDPVVKFTVTEDCARSASVIKAGWDAGRVVECRVSKLAHLASELAAFRSEQFEIIYFKKEDPLQKTVWLGCDLDDDNPHDIVACKLVIDEALVKRVNSAMEALKALGGKSMSFPITTNIAFLGANEQVGGQTLIVSNLGGIKIRVDNRFASGGVETAPCHISGLLTVDSGDTRYVPAEDDQTPEHLAMLISSSGRNA